MSPILYFVTQFTIPSAERDTFDVMRKASELAGEHNRPGLGQKFDYVDLDNGDQIVIVQNTVWK